MILVVQHYIPSDPARLDELNAAVAMNERLGIFEDFVPLEAPGDRLRYGHVFRHCAARFPGKVCVLANTDIVFDDSARLLPGIVRQGRLVTLTRWENDATPRMIGHIRGDRFYSGSQDVWAFIGGDLIGIGDSVPMGYVGCDQAILGEALAAGVAIVNPALSIKTRHYHASQERDPDRPGVPGTYVYPELTTVHTTGSVMHHEWPQA